MGYVVAVDTGGTFSDCVVIDEDGRVTATKSPSTPPDFSEGVMDAIGEAASLLDCTVPELLADATLFAHGTTVATNLLLERSGSKTGFITTIGHEDAIVIGRVIQKVADLAESEITDVVHLRKAVPVVPPQRIKGVHERVDCFGNIVAPLDFASVERAVSELVADGVEAIAISLLWSFLQPDHEQSIRDHIVERHPDVFVTISSDLAPVIKEYERGMTTVLNAYLSPRTGRYLKRLGGRLREARLSGTPVVMQSWGGVGGVDAVAHEAVHLLVSGPAGGVTGARLLGQMLGYSDIITTDVGGTSFDVGVVDGGEPVLDDAPVFDKFHLAVPVISVATVGAGGGSIAWIEADTGLLCVGPRSAGARPGPACYAQGGVEPTVTDANVVLGRINPENFLGGRRTLDAGAARAAVEERIARRASMEVVAAASAIVDIADAHMADLVRKATLERGRDPRRFVIFAFGGAGPVHVGAFGRGVGAHKAIVPMMAAEFSAFGIAGSDVMCVEQRSDPSTFPIDPARASAVYAVLEARIDAALERNGVERLRRNLFRFARVRYRGQVHELDVPVAAGPLDAAALERVADGFERLYEERYGAGTGYRAAGIQLLGYSVRGMGGLVDARLRPLEAAASPDAAAAVVTARAVYFRERMGFVPTPIYDRALLLKGHVVPGPAIIESQDTTVVVHPGQRVDVDRFGNLELYYEALHK